MNNSLVVENLEPATEDIAPQLNSQESKTLRIIEAIQEVKQTKAWSSLKEEVFDGLRLSLERELRAEAKKEDPDPKRLNRLSGELKWADKYSDLSKLEDSYRLELQRIRTRKNG